MPIVNSRAPKSNGESFTPQPAMAGISAPGQVDNGVTDAHPPQESPISRRHPVVGQPFNPWRGACGFYPPDIVGCNTELKLTDGQKRLYERGVRWAGKKGVFWYGFDTMARALGKSTRQVKDDMAALESKRLMRHTRRRRQSNLYCFLWHLIFEVQSTALQDENLEMQDPPLEVQDGVILKVQPTALELCTYELRTLNPVKSGGEADYSPRIENHDARSGGGSLVAGNAKTKKRKHQDSPAKSAGYVDSRENTRATPTPKAPAFHGDWEAEELDAAYELLSEHLPQDIEEWPGGRASEEAPEWLIPRVLDAGLGADPAEVLAFLESKLASGWDPPNWKSYIAVTRKEFERRWNRAEGVQWSDQDRTRVGAALKQYMEGDDPPDRFEHSCELRANGATARDVIALLERKFNNQKYRPGGAYGPRGWNWFLKVIGNEFSETERAHLPEPPAAPHRDHRATPEEMEEGIEALDSIAVSVKCGRCGGSVVQYVDGTFKGCDCAPSKLSPGRKQPARVEPAPRVRTAKRS